MTSCPYSSSAHGPTPSVSVRPTAHHATIASHDRKSHDTGSIGQKLIRLETWLDSVIWSATSSVRESTSPTNDGDTMKNQFEKLVFSTLTDTEAARIGSHHSGKASSPSSMATVGIWALRLFNASIQRAGSHDGLEKVFTSMWLLPQRLSVTVTFWTLILAAIPSATSVVLKGDFSSYGSSLLCATMHGLGRLGVTLLNLVDNSAPQQPQEYLTFSARLSALVLFQSVLLTLRKCQALAEALVVQSGAVNETLAYVMIAIEGRTSNAFKQSQRASLAHGDSFLQNGLVRCVLRRLQATINSDWASSTCCVIDREGTSSSTNAEDTFREGLMCLSIAIASEGATSCAIHDRMILQKLLSNVTETPREPKTFVARCWVPFSVETIVAFLAKQRSISKFPRQRREETLLDPLLCELLRSSNLGVLFEKTDCPEVRLHLIVPLALTSHAKHDFDALQELLSDHLLLNEENHTERWLAVSGIIVSRLKEVFASTMSTTTASNNTTSVLEPFRVQLDCMLQVIGQAFSFFAHSSGVNTAADDLSLKQSDFVNVQENFLLWLFDALKTTDLLDVEYNVVIVRLSRMLTCVKYLPRTLKKICASKMKRTLLINLLSLRRLQNSSSIPSPEELFQSLDYFFGVLRPIFPPLAIHLIAKLHEGRGGYLRREPTQQHQQTAAVLLQQQQQQTAGPPSVQCPSKRQQLSPIVAAALVQQWSSLPLHELFDRITREWISVITSLSMVSPSQIASVEEKTVAPTVDNATRSMAVTNGRGGSRLQERTSAKDAVIQRAMDFIFLLFKVIHDCFPVCRSGKEQRALRALVGVCLSSSLSSANLVWLLGEAACVGSRSHVCPVTDWTGKSTRVFVDDLFSTLSAAYRVTFCARSDNISALTNHSSKCSPRLLAQLLVSSGSMNRNQWLVMHYLADVFENVHPACAAYFRSQPGRNALPSLYSLTPQSLFIKGTSYQIKRELTERAPISLPLTEALRALSGQKMAARALKDCAQAAMMSLQLWMPDGTLPPPSLCEAYQGHKAPSQMCVAGIRTALLVELLEYDLKAPLHNSDSIVAMNQLSFQVSVWLCGDRMRNLSLLLGGTVTNAHVNANRSSPSIFKCPMLVSVASVPPSCLQHASEASPSGSPLNSLCSLLVTLEDVWWKVSSGWTSGISPGVVQTLSELGAACSTTQSLIEPWALTTDPPPTYVGLRCPFLASYRPSTNISAAANGTSREESLVSAPPQIHTFHSRMIVSWWTVADLVEARWQLHELLVLIRLCSFSPSSDGLTVLRARTALLCLIRRFGGDLFVKSPLDESLLLHQIPCVVWLPVLEELIAIHEVRMMAHDIRGCRIMQALTCVASVAYPRQSVWPLLFSLYLESKPKRALATEVLSIVSKSSKEARLVVETATKTHSAMRIISVSPVEQLAIDVRIMLSSTRQMQATTSSTMVDQVWDTLLNHLTQFRDRKPTTEAERYYRVELLPFTEQLLEVMLRHKTLSSLKESTTYTGDRRALETLRDKLDEVMRAHPQVALSSLLPKHLLQSLTLMLQHHGVVLLDMRDVVCLHPHLWDSHRRSVLCMSLEPIVTVFPSAQRPKRITFKIHGGSQHGAAGAHFLVKGNEDLRQDQRLQRLLRIFNHMASVPIATYSVVPLTPSVGVVEWVMNSETMSRMIQQYRGLSGIPLQREMSLLSKPEDRVAFAQYDSIVDASTKLELFHKIQAGDKSSSRPTHCELRSMLMYVAESSSAFISRRKLFATSLGTMSIVGHLIGLGDRHPSNLLIDRKTFLVTHIDFGDAFGRAERRATLPERVPFRATKMLERCLPVGGFQDRDGHFSVACLRAAMSFADPTPSATNFAFTMLEQLLSFCDRQLSSSVRSPPPIGVRDVVNRWSLYAGGGDRFARAFDTMISWGGEDVESNPISTPLISSPENTAALDIQRWWRRRMSWKCDDVFDDNGITTLESIPGKRDDGSPKHSILDGEWEERSVRPRVRHILFSPSAHAKVATKNVSRSEEVRDVIAALIGDATSDVNLAQQFSGWMPFW